MFQEPVTWDAAYSLLSEREESLSSETICAAITRLGKPYNDAQVSRAAPLVSRYLNHKNFLVRNQAIWFLGCWGKRHAYLPAIIERAQSDEELDNRAFAARCAGQILKNYSNANAIRVLMQMAKNEAEEPDVRLAAYGALIYAFHGAGAKSVARQFEPMGDKKVSDFDGSWLVSLEKWLNEIPIKLN